MCYLDILKDWQTLIGAGIALVAAVCTIRVMNGQRRDETTRHQHAEKRKKMSARAAMPDALNDLAVYADEWARRLVGPVRTPLDPPTAAINTLKSVIEFIDDDAAARTFELVSWYQVHRARLAHRVPSPPHPEFYDRLYDTALLKAYVDSLFEYARNRIDHVATDKPTAEAVLGAVRVPLEVSIFLEEEEHRRRFDELVERRHAAE